MESVPADGGGVPVDLLALSDDTSSGDGLTDVEQQRRYIAEVHNAVVGHHGISATLRLLRQRNLHWPQMRRSVVDFVHSCAVCQKSRITSHDTRDVEPHVIEAYEPFEEVCLDSIVGLPEDQDGNTSIIVAICTTTRFTELFAAPDLSAKSAAKFLLSLFGRYGKIGRIRSDCGGQFVSDLVKELLDLTNTAQITTIGYRPQANGIVERVNGEVMRHLRAVVSHARIRSKWSIGLPIVQRIINARHHSALNCSPMQLLYGSMVTPHRGIIGGFRAPKEMEVSKYMQELYDYQLNALRASQLHLANVLDNRVDQHVSTNPKSFNVGDYVVVAEGLGEPREKLDMAWRGPLLVVQGKGNIYTCQNLCTGEKEEFDVSVLRLFELASDADPLTVAAMDDDSDPVDKIIDYHIGTPRRKKTYDFLVRFRSGVERWLPYMEVRHLEALDKYLQDNSEAKQNLKL